MSEVIHLNHYQYVNYIKTATGSVKAVCECCGRKSRPVKPNHKGEPDLWELPIGWSEASFPVEFKHSDGSFGSFYKCPSCKKKLEAGHKLKLRNYKVNKNG